MLLQTNSYIVPPEKRAEHARLMRRFRQVLNKVGCDSFEVYEQVGANWSSGPTTGRFVQIMRFRDRKHQMAVQNAERTDPVAQQLIAEFCELINYPYQQDQRQFAVGFYTSAIPVAPVRTPAEVAEEQAAAAPQPEESGTEATEHAAAEEAAQVHSEAQTEEASQAEVEESVRQPEPAVAAEEPADEQLASDTDGLEEELASEAKPAEDAQATSEMELTQTEMSAEFEETRDETPLESAEVDPMVEQAEETAAEEELQPAELSAGEEDLLAESPFEEDDALFADEKPEESADDLPSEAAHESAAHPAPASNAHPQPRFDDASLEDDLQIDDDDISRLAEELAAGEDEAHDPHQPGATGHGHASGNGAH